MKGLSLPRIKVNDFLNIKVPVIQENDQKQIVLQIEAIETQIADLQKQIELIPNQKEQILKKYLE